MSKANKPNIALLGLGAWGKNLLRVLHELDVLALACDPDASTLRERQAAFPDCQFTSDPEEIFSDTGIDAVVIATPAESHYRMARRALSVGKDVFVEKPLSLTETDGESLVQLAAENRRVLMVGHILQYHPALLRIKSMLEKGELGKLQYVYSSRLNLGKFRTEENSLWSFAPHDISAILMLLDEEPLAVNAFGGAYLNPGISDTTLTTLSFRNGVKGHIFVSWLHPFKEQKLVVVGSAGMAVFNDVSDEKLVLYRHGIQWQNGKVPVAEKREYENIALPDAEPLRAELEHFLHCIDQRTAPRTDGREGVRVLRTLQRAQQALSGHSRHGEMHNALLEPAISKNAA